MYKFSPKNDAGALGLGQFCPENEAWALGLQCFSPENEVWALGLQRFYPKGKVTFLGIHHACLLHGLQEEVTLRFHHPIYLGLINSN